MTLDQYIRSGHMRACALAARCEISAASMSRIRNGKQSIGLKLAKRIEQETGGLVTLTDLAVELVA